MKKKLAENVSADSDLKHVIESAENENYGIQIGDVEIIPQHLPGRKNPYLCMFEHAKNVSFPLARFLDEESLALWNMFFEAIEKNAKKNE